ncbi:M15 family metallopeptidase [Motilimonas sp. 1_MG-2023]|uniref:M15 family metallopeptidase n=1 Tax=Motilimonas sp. 1_MG-2023 TaxID=3062672 RepID=UPI0026E28AC0|nr:M15 family metallopeptidase [Motilimonas sp. 1_MG-2023]MDO6525155.1 M15 family metallopeptidase [Motilimonas sp. 1_MG-2023]
MKLSKRDIALKLTGQVSDHLAPYGPYHWLEANALAAFLSMQQAAKNDGIELDIASSFRGFSRQQLIWDGKMSGERPVLDHLSRPLDTALLTPRDKILAILHWSALPGASRHHWGTDIDVYSPALLPDNYQLQLVPSEYQLGGCQHPLALWLEKNMTKFGFYLPYQKQLGGVAIEPWHLSYHPVAARYQQMFTIDMLDSVLAQSSVLGKSTLRIMLPTIWQRFITQISTP